MHDIRFGWKLHKDLVAMFHRRLPASRGGWLAAILQRSVSKKHVCLEEEEYDV
jgi:hypothetical protein